MTVDRRKLERLERSIGHAFGDAGLLEQALTHSSHAYESRADAPEDNEQLEFLGDSVIGLIAAEFFFRAFPERSEGELSKLKASATSTLALAQLAKAVKLDKIILLGRGEEKGGGRKKVSILAGAFEALTGALFLDGGFDAARAFISGLLGSSLKPIKSGSQTISNAKSALQEICQKAGLATPLYRRSRKRAPPTGGRSSSRSAWTRTSWPSPRGRQKRPRSRRPPRRPSVLILAGRSSGSLPKPFSSTPRT